MIITSFIKKVLIIVRRKFHIDLIPNGINDEELAAAMSHTKLMPEYELVLHIWNNTQPDEITWVVGPSLGDVADTCFMDWCWTNLGQLNGYYLNGIDKRPFAYSTNTRWPLSKNNLRDMSNVYNAMLHHAERKYLKGSVDSKCKE